MRFDYRSPENALGIAMPLLPLTLNLGSRTTIDTIGLVDSGSTINVLPYSEGLSSGAVWNEQTIQMRLTGSLSQFEARGLYVYASIPDVTGDYFIRLVFAWIEAEIPGPILGQTDFFDKFDVCFFKSENTFDVTWKNPQ